MSEDDLIASALAALAGGVGADGCLPTFSSTDPVNFAASRTHRTTFAAAQALWCLNAFETGFPGRADPRIAARLARFLRRQAGPDGAYNYWADDAPERASLPYPDDCDDTFAALAALATRPGEILDGTRLAEAAQLLVRVETVPGGPYRTWAAGPDAPAAFRDVDVAVNGAIATFLATQEVRLPGLDAFLADAARSGAESPYYPGPVHVAALLARATGAAHANDLVPRILAARGAGRLWKEPLETALAWGALVRCGHPEEVRDADVAALAQSIVADGWRPHPFCLDPAREGRPCYAGAPALTAAFALEALGLRAVARRQTRAIANPRASMHAAVQEDAIARCARLPRELRASVVAGIRTVASPGVTLLPYAFARALGPRGEAVPDELLARLARASVWGWVAYDVFDDFLDEEGAPAALPAATFCLRALADEYRVVAERIPAMREAFATAMDAIDGANAWEVARCRPAMRGSVLVLPDRLPYRSYAPLADRSIGHGLAAVALMHETGADEDAIRAVTGFFRAYLIARQLHDDAHDWADDLARGQVNAVGARVLAAWRARHAAAEVDVVASGTQLRELFWQELAPSAVRAILRHASQAERSLKDAGLPGGNAFAQELLAPLRAAARRTLQERDRAAAFIARYRSV